MTKVSHILPIHQHLSVPSPALRQSPLSSTPWTDDPSPRSGISHSCLISSPYRVCRPSFTLQEGQNWTGPHQGCVQLLRYEAHPFLSQELDPKCKLNKLTKLGPDPCWKRSFAAVQRKQHFKTVLKTDCHLRSNHPNMHLGAATPSSSQHH